jgi:hypothetical protein
MIPNITSTTYGLTTETNSTSTTASTSTLTGSGFGVAKAEKFLDLEPDIEVAPTFDVSIFGGDFAIFDILVPQEFALLAVIVIALLLMICVWIRCSKKRNQTSGRRHRAGRIYRNLSAPDRWADG